MSLREALEVYKNVYMAYRNFAERTRVEYQNDLEDFIDFLGKSGITTVKQLKLQVIERYVAGLERRGYASLTRKRKVVIIRSFLTFLYQDGYIDINIAKMVVLPYAESTTPNILTATECHRLREACAGNPRDRAIVELLLQTGMKLSELTRLTLNDIEFEKVEEKETGFVRVRGGRGKKDRMLPVNPQACVSLRGYLYNRGESASNKLFLNRFGEPLRGRGIQKMLKKHLLKSGVARASIHTLRHTFGMQRIAKGQSLETVKDLMGIKDVRSASPYLVLARKTFKDAVQESLL